MSYLYYFFLAGLIMFVSPDYQLQSTLANMGDTTVSGVGIGRKKKDCAKKGVCIIGSDIMITGIDDRHTIAKISFSGEGSLNSMFISYSDLTKNARIDFFSDEYFIMEEEYVDILKVKDKVYKIDIQKGKYPITKYKKGLKIQFQ